MICDTREQDPLEFSRFGVETIREGLKFGDYAAISLNPKNGESRKLDVFFDRKSLPDLFGTIANEKRNRRLRDRCREANEVGAKLVLAIEGSDQDVMDGTRYSQAEPVSVMKALTTMWLKYDLIPMFCANRAIMEWRMMNIWATVERLSGE